MQASVTEEGWLLLLVLIVPACVLAYRWLRATMSTPRVITVALFRSMLIACVAAMLAGVSSVRETDKLTTVLVIDGSDSVRRFASEAGVFGVDSQGRAIAWNDRVSQIVTDVTGTLGPEDLVSVVVFDGRSLAVSAPSRRPLESPPVDVRGREGTDIEGAIKLAARLVPPDSAGRIVLFSDGVQTGGDAVAAAKEVVGSAETAGAGTIMVDVVPLSYRVDNEVMIDAVDAPPSAVAGGKVTLRVALRSTDPVSGRVEVRYNDELIDVNGAAPGTGRRVSLPIGRAVVPIEIELGDRALHQFTPTFIPDDPGADRVAQNNSAETFTFTPGTASVLIIDGRNEGASGFGGVLSDAEMERNPLRKALEASDIETRSITPSDMPANLLGLQGYDLVVLQDIGAADIPREAHTMLSEYVSTLGGGLVMVGGPDGFGAGGWKGTDLEPILPVLLDLPDEVIEPQAAIVFVLDKSGSMSNSVGGSSRSQQEIANDGAAYAILTLDPTDMLMVVAFSGSAETIVPMGPVGDNQQRAARVRSIASSGGTSLMPAMNRAGRALLDVDAKVKHMVILSDGQSSGSVEDMEQFAGQLQEEGISISTIAIGDGAHNKNLLRIATAGGGNFYPVTDPMILPQIFIRDTQFVRRPFVRLKPFLPVVTSPSSPVISSSNAWRAGVQVPPLEGVVLTQSREDTRVTNALTTDDGYPLLSHWFVGRGQVAGFTSDASVWARGWVGSNQWSGYRSMWTQIARTIARPAVDQNAELVASVEDGELVMTYNAFEEDGAPIDGLRVEGEVFAPDTGESSPVRLTQTGPGQYEARVPAPARGNYVVALTPSRGARQLPAVIGGASRALGPEYSSLRSNVGLLQSVAEAGGGQVFSIEQFESTGALGEGVGVDLFDRSGVESSRAMTPLWPILLAWTIVIFVLDVGTRRVAWDRLLNRQLMRDWKRAVREAGEGKGQAAAATIGGLRAKASETRAKTRNDRAASPADQQPQAAAPTTQSQAERMASVMARQKDTRERLRAEQPARQEPAAPNKPGVKQPPPVKDRSRKVADTSKGTQTNSKKGATEDKPKSTTEGLLAAKRRARDRDN